MSKSTKVTVASKTVNIQDFLQNAQLEMHSGSGHIVNVRVNFTQDIYTVATETLEYLICSKRVNILRVDADGSIVLRVVPPIQLT